MGEGLKGAVFRDSLPQLSSTLTVGIPPSLSFPICKLARASPGCHWRGRGGGLGPSQSASEAPTVCRELSVHE